MSNEKIFGDIEAELKRAEAHGGTFGTLHEAHGVIAEELYEVWLITVQKKKNRDPEVLRKELIQVAAMAIKAIQSLENFTGGKV